jgi:U3 small nucleolar RNA-associated protein 25
MLIVEQADVISMQNWEHLLHVISHLNKLPKGAHGCDFSRVQNVFLDELAAHTRQNIVFSEFEFPELNGFLKSLGNCMGKWKYTMASQDGFLKKGKQALPQFHMINAASHDLIPSARFAYFTENILPKYIQSTSHICIFISSYLDFVQVREHLQQLELAHVVLSEYSSQQEISTARTTFFNGKARFLLVSERFHFFKRYSIRGIRKLIYYSLPEHAPYYEDWCGMLQNKTDVPILVSKYDYLKAERIVGTKKMANLFQS